MDISVGMKCQDVLFTGVEIALIGNRVDVSVTSNPRWIIPQTGHATAHTPTESAVYGVRTKTSI